MESKNALTVCKQYYSKHVTCIFQEFMFIFYTSIVNNLSRKVSYLVYNGSSSCISNAFVILIISYYIVTIKNIWFQSDNNYHWF